LAPIADTLTHADVEKIMRLVETLHRSKLQFVRIEAEGLEISISKDGSATAYVAAPLFASKCEDPEPPPRVPIPSPSVGVFRSPPANTGQVPHVGSVIDATSVLGYIQVLDDMNDVTAGVPGKIVEACVRDGDFVEFGQPLYRIIPVTGSQLVLPGSRRIGIDEDECGE
jgi:biotin carboxyl carrier protein